MRRRLPDLLGLLGLLLALAGVGYLVIRAIDGAKLADPFDVPSAGLAEDFLSFVPWLVMAAAGLVLLAAAWLLARRATDSSLALRSAERRAERAERQLDQERQVNRELRRRQRELMHRRRSFTDLDDVRALVLHTAMSLLEAEKGMLLIRRDKRADQHGGDEGQELDIVRHDGFKSDPVGSELAQRLARLSLAHDEVRREDQPAADGIENLVAIPVFVADEFSGIVVCANSPDAFRGHEDEVLLSLGDHAGAVFENTRLQADLRQTYLGSVRMLAEAIEAKDTSLRGHSEAVAGYVLAVAEELGMDAEQRERLLLASLLHDVGKIGVAEQILLKPGRLTPEERSAIELHPRIGFKLVRQVPALEEVAVSVLHHHERFDGQGYPSGLRGGEIPLEARVIAVADAFAAMIARRPYSEPRTVQDACAELERCAGSQFDPDVVRLFTEEVRQHPPGEADEGLVAALEDPELALRRGSEGGLIGSGAATLVDPLTLLYSRRYLDEALGHRLAQARIDGGRVTLLLAELQLLSTVNRREGLTAGDAELMRVAQAAQRTASRAGGIACRHSGRRIAVVLPGGAEAARAAAIELEAEADKLRWTAVEAEGDEDAESLLDRARADLHG